MQRLPNWQSALEIFITEHRADAFSYGSFDCCLFPADAVLVMTGVDLAAPFRGKYNSRRSAIAAMREYAGAGSVKATIEKAAAAHEMPEVSIMKAGRGDMVLLKRPSDWSLGIIAMNGLEVTVLTKNGLENTPLDSSMRAWRV